MTGSKSRRNGAVDSTAIVRIRSPVAYSKTAPRPERSTRSKTSSKRGRSTKPQSLLILHLDAEKLHADGLHLGDVAQYSGVLSAAALGSDVVIKDTTTLDHLHRTLAELAMARKNFDVVVIVAHSNATGAKIASDQFVDWSAFTNYLKPFGPRRLLLVACKAGRWDAGETLFTGISNLRRIFACPVSASKDFGAMMLFAVPYVVAKRRPKDKHVFWSQVAAIAVTGRQLREWRRTTDKGNPDSSVFDLLADIADPYARKVPGALGSILKTVFGR